MQSKVINVTDYSIFWISFIYEGEEKESVLALLDTDCDISDTTIENMITEYLDNTYGKDTCLLDSYHNVTE